MEFAAELSHHHGLVETTERDIADVMRDLFEAPRLSVKKGSTKEIRNHLHDALATEGWSDEIEIADKYDLTIFSIKEDVAFQLQTGNASRAAYDLLKIQYLYLARRINVAVLALPTSDAAKKITSNVASFERVGDELLLFDRMITVPIHLIGFK